MQPFHADAQSNVAGSRGTIPLREWLRALVLPSITDIEIDVAIYGDTSFAGPVCCKVRGLFGERLLAATCRMQPSACPPCKAPGVCEYGKIFDSACQGAGGGGGFDALHPYWLQGVSAAHELAAGTRWSARLSSMGLTDAGVQAVHLAFRDALNRLRYSQGRPQVVLSASRAQRRSVQLAVGEGSSWWLEACTPLLLPPRRQEAYSPPCPAAPWLPKLLSAGVHRLDALAQKLGAANKLPRVDLPALEAIQIAAGTMQGWEGEVDKPRQRARTAGQPNRSPSQPESPSTREPLNSPASAPAHWRTGALAHSRTPVPQNPSTPAPPHPIGYPLEHGVSGAVLLRNVPAEVGQLLELLQHVSVGKKTTMGFGWLRVEPVPGC